MTELNNDINNIIRSYKGLYKKLKGLLNKKEGVKQASEAQVKIDELSMFERIRSAKDYCSRCGHQWSIESVSCEDGREERCWICKECGYKKEKDELWSPLRYFRR
jgi:hypothetical protein